MIGLRVARDAPPVPTLNLRGRSVDRSQPGAYQAETHILHIPCPGEYRFHAGTEDTSNGNSSGYKALIRLFDPSPSPAEVPCGGRPPPLQGHMSIRLQDKLNQLFVVKGGRSNAGAFEGGLTLSSLPQCNRTYTLEASLDLAGWDRSVMFDMQTISFSSTLQERTIEDKRC